ncbi:hypothetical protein MASR1M68_03210 [Elusimicrobiota bacterium]
MSENEQSKPVVASDGLDFGLFINRQYVTVKRIGVGGFGTVWQAYDFSLRNFIAIKELLPEYAEPKFVEMFYKEALIAKNIIHDNIVRVQHFWKGSNGTFYVVLDYVRGVDLETLIRKCNQDKILIPWQLSTLICINVLKAIDYANRIARDSITGNPYGIVYRDISPGNVLLSFDGNVKLSDFGIAKTADEIKDSIPQKVITGKYPYMSPEQIKGQSDIDHRTDIFSVAVLFYEMLTGKQLYQGTNEEIKAQVLGKKFDTEGINAPGVPHEMFEVISKALEKDRNVRYEKAIEMYRDIRRILKGVDTDDLSIELSEFVVKVMKENVIKSEKLVENVKSLTVVELERNSKIPKIQCQDFIVGQAPQTSGLGQEQPQYYQQQTSQPNIQQNQQAPIKVEERRQPSLRVEAKGKTVFEEVGDWLFKKFDELKKTILKVIIAIFLATIVLAGVDVFLQITPFGKKVYDRMNPPDVVISTVPSGAVVSMKTKDGEVILNNISSATEIPIRKVKPGSYVVTALKDGFRPVQRVVQIEGQKKAKKGAREKIEIMFDFVLNVESVPSGASVYVDGNKFGTTPCKAQLLAAPHTIRLSMEGFEDLGSNAKERKEGQCNVDFTMSSVEEIFAEVDKRFWECELKNVDSENVFSVKGNLFKKMNVTSEPKGMMIHVQGESQPRGNTPLNTSFKIGKYNIRFLDPSARYGEYVKEVKVDATSDSNVFVKMNKFVTFKVRSKDSPGDTFITKVKISNQQMSITKDISTSKPIRIALPVETFDVLFYGDAEYKSTKISNVNVDNVSTVTGELEYAKVDFTIAVKSATTSQAQEAFIWQGKKLLGKTEANGIFKSSLLPGKYELKVIAKGFDDQIVNIELTAKGKNHTDVFVLEPQQDIAVSSGTLTDTTSNKVLVDNLKKAEPKEEYKFTPKRKETKKKSEPVKPEIEPETQESASVEQQVVVCMYCGYVNTVPKGKRLRFCVNCAKPLK